MKLPISLHYLLAAWLLGVAVTCATAAPGDWPQWRGANRDDISADTGLLKSWPAEGPPLVWRATGLGSGYSGVSILDDRLFTAGDKGSENFVLALNRTDGKQLWSAKLGKAGAPGWGGFGGPRCTPTLDGGCVYALGQYGELVCLEMASGKEVWRKNLQSDFGGKLPEWGFAESPLVDGDKVICTPGGAQGAVVALNKKTGDVVWRCAAFTDGAQYTSLLPVEIDGVRQYVQLTQASVVGVAAKDGALLWQAPRKGNTAVIPTPIYQDNQVYVASGYDAGCNLFKITRADGAFKASQVYAKKWIENHHGGVVLVGDRLYGYCEKKGWTCQDFKTGEIVWSTKDNLGKGSLTFADGHLYLRHEEGPGTLALIEATPSGYKETGRFDPPDRSKQHSWPHPVVAGGRLYIRDQDVLLCYDVKAK